MEMRSIPKAMIIPVVILLVLLNNEILAMEDLDDARVPCLFKDSLNITDGQLDDQQKYHHKGVVYEQSQYGTFKYEIINGSIRMAAPSHIRGCICAIKGVCTRLCCDPNDDEECPGSVQYAAFVTDEKTEDTIHMNDLSEIFGIVYGRPCSVMYSAAPHKNENFTIFTNGSLLEAGLYKNDQYCLYHDGNGTTARLCFGNDENLYESKFRIYPYGMMFSVFFLVVTFLVYALIPELRNLHGKNLMCYVFTLAVAYTSMAIIQKYTIEISSMKEHCFIIGYIAYIAFVSSFFWLNVMCFDIWWTFRGVRGVARDLEKRKFLLYSLYAWGCPLLIFTWAIMADNLDIIPYEYRPRFAHKSCFLQEDKLTTFLYLYMFMAAQLIANIALFVCTAYQIRKLQKETAQITKGESRKFNRLEADKNRFPLVRFSLYLRLFIVMGVSWIAELISWAASGAPVEYSYVTDIFNSLMGFFIFFLFVWKPKVKALIVKRYRLARGLQVPSSHTFRSSTQTTTSNVYSRQSTMNNAVQMKNIKCPEKLLNGDDANTGSNTDRD